MLFINYYMLMLRVTWKPLSKGKGGHRMMVTADMGKTFFSPQVIGSSPPIPVGFVEI